MVALPVRAPPPWPAPTTRSSPPRGLMALGVLASGFVNDADAAPTMAATARDAAANALPEAA